MAKQKSANRNPGVEKYNIHQRGFPGACNVGDPGLIPGLGRFPGEGNGNPLQDSCQENPWTEEPGSPWDHKVLYITQ